MTQPITIIGIAGASGAGKSLLARQLHEGIVQQGLEQIFVDVPLDICLARRLRRDIQERGRSLDSVLSQYQQTVRPMYYEFIEPTKQHADLIVPRGGQNQNAVDVLHSHLQRLVF